MSKVNIYGHQSKSSCGYCKSHNWATYGMGCTSMRPEDYEGLMLRGWRRCGSYYYKPIVDQCCCKPNTIRCDATQFVPNKDQEKVMKKFKNYLNGIAPSNPNKKEKRLLKRERLNIPEDLLGAARLAVQQVLERLGISYEEKYAKLTKNEEKRRKHHNDFSLNSAMPIYGACKVKGMDISPVAISEDILAILQPLLSPSYCIHSTTNGYINIQRVASENPQTEAEVPIDEERRPHSYSFDIVPDDFQEDAFQLYKQYQIAVHKDKPNSLTKSGFTRFLCESSLMRSPPSEKHPLGLGSFHIRHFLDKKLFAIGVVDVLPTGLSSVYFIYDPHAKSLAPGKFSAIKELELINSSRTEEFRYYYMGYYIHTCHKMRYKGEYMPSELLCPDKYIWVPIQDCVATAERHCFEKLAEFSETTQGLPKSPDMDLSNLDLFEFLLNNIQISLASGTVKMCEVNPQAMSFLVSTLSEILPLIGKTLAMNLLFAFN